MTYTTIADLVLELRALAPELELADEQLMEIIRENMSGRYEDITGEDVDEMLLAAYARAGVPAEQAERIVYS